MFKIWTRMTLSPTLRVDVFKFMTSSREILLRMGNISDICRDI